MALKIPTIFTAIDQFTGPVNKMAKSMANFSGTATAAVAQSERAFRKFNPVAGALSSQLSQQVGAVAAAGAAISAVNFSFNSLKEYEDAVASFRVIVSDLTEKEFEAYKKQIALVAQDTKKSSVDVAKAFESIAGLNATFAETADGLGAVSKAAITLAKASGDELGVSASNLVGIMNQFSFAANDSARVMNVLAAGQAAGAASISNISESFKNFGSVAAGANISIEQSVGLIETVGQFSIFGAEAGTKLRGSVLQLQKANKGYASGQFNVMDALKQVQSEMAGLTTQAAKDAAILKIFGAENITVGKILLGNIGLVEKYTQSVTGTNAAAEQAALKTDTLSNRMEELKAKFINILTTGSQTDGFLNKLKLTIGFLTNNLDTILAVTVSYIGAMIAWRLAIWAARASMIAYNIVLGVSTLLLKKNIFALRGNMVAMAAYRVASIAGAVAMKIATAGIWLFNAALWANPIVWIVAGIIALIAALVLLVVYWDEVVAAVKAAFNWMMQFRAVQVVVQAVADTIALFKNYWDLLVQSFESGGILGAIMAIGKIILSQLILPLENLLKLVGKVTGIGAIQNAAASLTSFREGLTSTDAIAPKEAINPRANQQRGAVDVNINNNTPFPVAAGSNNTDFVKLNTSSTYQFGR